MEVLIVSKTKIAFIGAGSIGFTRGLLTDILSVCQDGTRLCIAADLTLPDAFLKTRRIGAWKKNPPQIGKRPCVFLLLS